MVTSKVKVRVEQAVYGTFPFWNRGYALLARSAECRMEWIAALKTACQRYGERPSGVVEADSLFALTLADGHWMIVGVFPQGCDDQHRPGALAFHGLFVGPWAYWLAGADPFTFASALRRDWSFADLDAILPSGSKIGGTRHSDGLATQSHGAGDELVVPAVAALRQGRRVVVQSTRPIDVLAQSIWCALPRRIRCRATLATWAFDNANQFDLVALPKLAGVALDRSALILPDRKPHS